MDDINMKPKKLAYGVGVNDADYSVAKTDVIGHVDGKRRQKLVWACPYYTVWANMLKRCSEKWQERTQPIEQADPRVARALIERYSKPYID